MEPLGVELPAAPYPLSTALGALAGAFAVLAICAALRVYLAWEKLSIRAQLPTTFWAPRFFRRDERRQTGASLRRVLDTSLRLKGPRGCYGTVFATTPVIHVVDPAVAQAVLRESGKMPVYDHFKHFSGDGTFTADGSDWAAKRRAVGAFVTNPRNAEDFFRCATDAAEAFCRELRAAAAEAKGAAGPGGVRVRFVERIQGVTLRTIHRFLTRVDVAPLPAGGRVRRVGAYLQAVRDIRMIVLARARSLWGLVERLGLFRPAFSSLAAAEAAAVAEIHGFASEATRRCAANSPLARLALRPSHGGCPAARNGSKALLDEAVTLLFAGQDTSAATMSWTAHLLSLRPEAQQRLRAELRAALIVAEASAKLGGEGGEGREAQGKVAAEGDAARNVADRIGRAALGKLPYLNAVIKEAMRLYPVAPFVARALAQDVAVQRGGEAPLVLPAGAVAIVWIWAMHHHPQHWERPDDFLPERWLGAGAANKAFMPFAAGPRGCPGGLLAQNGLRSMLSQLVHDFEIRPVGEPRRMPMQAGFTVLPQGSLELCLTPCAPGDEG